MAAGRLTLAAHRPRPIRLHRLEILQFRNIAALDQLRIETPDGPVPISNFVTRQPAARFMPQAIPPVVWPPN